MNKLVIRLSGEWLLVAVFLGLIWSAADQTSSPIPTVLGIEVIGGLAFTFWLGLAFDDNELFLGQQIFVLMLLWAGEVIITVIAAGVYQLQPKVAIVGYCAIHGLAVYLLVKAGLGNFREEAKRLNYLYRPRSHHF